MNSSVPRLNHVLRPGPGSFIGREDQLARLHAAIPSTRILTLVGQAGVGKSRLALRAASNLHARFDNGVHVFDASTQITAGTVVERVSNLLERQRVIRPGDEPLTDKLASCRLLLILDNCDPAVAECARLAADLLRACPGVRILATGRGPLHIAGEVVWTVPTLPVPPSGASRAAEIQESAAVKFLVARVRARLPGFTLNAETASPIARICQRLGGLPLALEIIALHVPRVGLARMAARVDPAYVLGLPGNSDAPPRHRSVRNALDWSYLLLPESERVLFARLATFVGGWTLEAAETVCSDERLPRSMVAALLDSLVGTSVLVLAEEGPSVRFRFAGLVHQYASHLLRASNEEELLHRRHAEYVAGLARKLHPTRLDANHPADLVHERGNLLAALRWAVRSNDADLTFELAIAGYTFWYLLGRFAEGEAWLTRCLALPTHDGLHHRRATVQSLAGHLALLSGHLGRARVLLSAALRTVQALADTQGISLALLFLSLAELCAGSLDAARDICNQSYAALQRMQREGSLARDLKAALLSMGARIAFELGEQTRATDLATQAASLAQEEGSRFWQARALHLQGLIAARGGQRLAAFQLLEQAIESQRFLGDAAGRVDSLCTLGQLRLDAGSIHDSLNAYIEAVSLAYENGQRLGVVWGLEGVAQALSSTQREQAVRLAGVCDVLRVQLGCVPWPAQARSALNWQGRVRSEAGAATFNAARSEGHRWALADALRLVATLADTPSRTNRRQNPLTPRERGVARLLVQDLSNQQISAVLGISVGTVRSHVDHILAKLGLHSRAQLAVWALQEEGRLSLAAPRGFPGGG
jgi:predicted ATPase/DNA-binding CsgD family transcriptional regulator